MTVKLTFFQRRRVYYVRHDTESVYYLGPKTWDLIPNVIKQPATLNAFRFRTERWAPERFPYRICEVCFR